MCGPCDVVLRAEPRAEQQGVVCPQRDASAGLDQLTQRYVANRSEDAKRDVAAGAHLERDAAAHHFVKHVRILNAAYAVSQPIGGKCDESLVNRGRSQQLSTVRNAGESGAARDIEGGGEFGCDSTTFIVAQPEPDNMSRAVAGVARGKTSQDSGIQGVSNPARSNDDGHTDADIFGGAPCLVQDDLQSWGEAADKRRIRGGVDLDLEPLRTLGRVINGRLANDPAHVTLVAHARTGHVVEALETEPATFVSHAQRRWPGPGQRVR